MAASREIHSDPGVDHDKNDSDEVGELGVLGVLGQLGDKEF